MVAFFFFPFVYVFHVFLLKLYYCYNGESLHDIEVLSALYRSGILWAFCTSSESFYKGNEDFSN